MLKNKKHFKGVCTHLYVSIHANNVTLALNEIELGELCQALEKLDTLEHLTTTQV